MPRSGPAIATKSSAGEIRLGENLAILQSLPSASVDLIYIDPPFNTGLTQKRTRITARRSDAGTRNGFGGARYETTTVDSPVYADSFDDYLAFLRPRLVEAHRLLAPTGSLFLHLDPREVHYAKVMLDQIFGRDCFRNEIIWAYDYGGKPRDRWPAKHDNVLWYSRSADEVHVPLRRDRPCAVYGAGVRGAGEGGARQDSHGRVVDHRGPDELAREDRVSHAEAAEAAGARSCACTPTPVISCWTSLPGAGRQGRLRRI